MHANSRMLANIVRQMCPPLLWSTAKKVRDAYFPVTEVPRYYGLLELDRKLEQYVDYDHGFFVELGGWDGITFSNSLYLERHRGWTGLLIEPAPTEYVKCKRNRPLASVHCCACVPFDFSEQFVHMTFCASMTAAHSTASERSALSDVPNHLESGRQFLAPDESVYEFGAIAKPLSHVLDEAAVTREIDLLILDVEGFEMQVLRGIDFLRHRPKFICVEVRDLGPIEQLLKVHGYRVEAQLTDYVDNKDFLFRRNSSETHDLR